MSRVVLVQVSPRVAATGAVAAQRLAGGGSRAYIHLGFNDWLDGVMGEPLFSAAIGFDENGWTSAAVPQTAAIGIATPTAQRAAGLAALVWPGAAINVQTGDDSAAAPAWSTRLSGKVAGAASKDGVLSLTVADLSAALNQPVCPTAYAGTGGLEGGTALTGQPKRRSWGRVFNVEAGLADPANNIYEFGDPVYPLSAFVSVKDRGRAGPTSFVGWQGSAAATLAALVAAAPPGGGAAVAPSIARVKWWTQPSGPLTADILGEVGAGYVETAPAIVAAIAATITAIPVDGLAAAIALRPDPAGVHIGTVNETAAAAMLRTVLGASMIWTISPAGSLQLLPIGFDNPVETLDFDSVERTDTYAPVKAVKVGYAPNNRVHTDAEISAAVLAGDITGLGPLATSPSADFATQVSGAAKPDNNATVGAPPTANRVTFSSFEGGTKGWGIRFNPSGLAVPTFGVGTQSGLQYIQAQIATTGTMQSVSMGTAAGYGFVVNAGEYLAVSALIQVAGSAGGGTFAISFYKADGSSAGAATLWTGTEASLTRHGSVGPVLVPTGAVMGYLDLYGTSGGAGTMYLTYQQPMVSSVPQVQASWPAFVAGPASQPGSDVTGQNTAADTNAVGGQTSATVLSNIATSTMSINAIVSDTILSRDEKPTLITYMTRVTNEQTSLANQLYSMGLSARAEKNNWDVARANLQTYVNGISPSYGDVNQDSPYNGPNFRSLRSAYETALLAVTNLISSYAQTAAQAATVNMFLDARFERISDVLAWAAFDGGIQVQDAGDGRRIYYPDATARACYTRSDNLLGPYDRVDVEFDVYYGAGVDPNSPIALGVQGFDAGGNFLWYASPYVNGYSVTGRNAWYRYRFSVTVNQQSNYNNTTRCQCYIYAFGGVYVRAPSATRVLAASLLLGADGRATTGFILPINWALGIKALQTSTAGLTQSNAGSSVTIHLPALSFSIDNARTYTYPATDFGGLGYSTTYAIYAYDPNFNGGGFISLTDDPNYAFGIGKILIGTFTTMNSGGTGGGQAGSRPPVCPAIEMLVATGHGAQRAGDLRDVGRETWLRTIDPATGKLGLSKLRSADHHLAHCVRLLAANGAAKIVSFDTPVPAEGVPGGYVDAQSAAGHIVWTKVGGAREKSEILEAVHVGLRWVAKLDGGGCVFFGGEEGDKMIATHNKSVDPGTAYD